MCNFFSQYYPLGELGTILSERLGGKVEAPDVDGIRLSIIIYKNAYAIILIDIHIAIENRCLWCGQLFTWSQLRSHVEVVVRFGNKGLVLTNGRGM